MKKSILSLFFIVLALSGCAEHFTNYNKEKFSIKHDALVITKCTLNHSRPCRVQWKHAVSGEVVWPDRPLFGSKIMNSDIMSLKPGTYHFHSVHSDPSGFSSRDEMIYYYDNNTNQNIVSFTVHPGEVLYLGRLNINTEHSLAIYKSFERMDDYSYVQQAFPKYFPELATRLQKRLFKFDDAIIALKKINKQKGLIEMKSF